MSVTNRAVGSSKGERTRHRILTAAVEHFAAVGFDGASVPEIARAVGVSHSTLYQHFGRKEDLFRAAVDADLTSLFAGVRSLDADIPTPEAISGIVIELVEASRTHPLARRVLGNLDADQAVLLRDLPTLAALERRLARALRRGQQAGTIRADLRPGSAPGLLSIVLGVIVLAVRLEDVPKLARGPAAIRFLADALRPPAP